MKKKLAISYLTLILFGMVGCVSQQDYNNLEFANTQLQQEVEELRYGADRLLRQATDYFANNQIDSAESKLSLLFSRHNESKEAQEGRVLLNKITSKKKVLEEINAWKQVESSSDIAVIKTYINSHPNGKYVKNAVQKLSTVKRENEKEAYRHALSQNSSYSWSKFIEDYPNRKDIADIKKKIIKAEIAEIQNSSSVTSLPASYQTDYGYSDNSSVNIENRTGYSLTVRYGGPSIKSVTIPAGGTRTVNLASGSYQVAATAGSVSCAGQESLHGSYTCSYYISTSYSNRY